MLYNNIHCFKEGMIIKQTIEHSTLILEVGIWLKKWNLRKKILMMLLHLIIIDFFNFDL